jgi:NADH:ubiquinone oxidoreductase subunit E/NAD-dependent dihydropyrimidine dehydrogenase PreA subunit
MVIHTRSPRVVRARRATVELLMAGHTGECVTDEHTHRCDLRKLADQLEGGAPRFLMRKPRWYPIEELNPYVRRDMSKCILCRKCIGACTEVAKKNLFSIAYRAFDSKVVVDSDEPLTTVACRDCGICIDYCPTGALSKSTRKDDLKGNSFPEGNTLIGKKRELLLEMLKTSQNQFGYVSREFMAQTAQSLDLSVSEVYGVTTFYSFLSTRPLGRNVIRICKSIPCCLKDAERVIESVAREVGITPGQTTGDGKFSFELTNCIGACDMAPAMLVNHDVYGHLTPGKIAKILRAYE